MTKSSLAGLFVFTFAAVCIAAEISREDYAFFLNESYSQYRRPGGHPNIEDQFYKIAQKNTTPDDAITAFAKSLAISTEMAVKYAQALIEANKFREKCEKLEPCVFQAGEPAYNALLDAGFADSKGDIAFSIGTNLNPREAKISFVRAIMNHPQRGRILADLYSYSRDRIYGSVLFTLEAPTLRQAILLRTEAYWSGWELSNDNGLYVSFAEMARERAQSLKGADKDAVYLMCTEALIWTQLWAGLTNRALDVYNKLPKNLRGKIPTAPPAVLKNEDRLNYAQESASLASDLAYAVYLSGDVKTARRLLEARTKLQKAESFETTFDEEFRASALEEAMAPRYSADDLYNMYLLGNPKDEPEKQNKENYGKRGEAKGWFFSMAKSCSAVREVGAQRLKAAGYFELATALIQQEDYYSLPDPTPELGDILPNTFLDRRAYWEDQVNQARETYKNNNKQEKLKASGIMCLTSNPILIEERKVPAQLRRPATESTDANSDQPEPRIPGGVELPVDRGSVVRYAEENGEKMIVYLSAELDRPGEIPAFGLWFRKTRSGGKEWEQPLYLNLQQYFPYVVVSESKVPMLSNGKLQIEVEIKEIDTGSISFPPVNLLFKREERDIYVVINLADLKKDSDADSLTDIVEHRLGLCPDNPDTDGDGIPDGSDPLPLTAFNPDASPESKQVAAAILSETQEYDKGAIIVAPRSSAEALDVCNVLGLKAKPPDKAETLFIVADPEIFSGILLPGRLLLYQQGEMASLSESNAPFFAPYIQVFPNRNGSKYYVIWSAGWVGGEFIIRRQGNEYRVEVRSKWIT